MLRLTIAAAAFAMFAPLASAQDITISEATEIIKAIMADEAKHTAYCEMQALYQKGGDVKDKVAAISADFEKVWNSKTDLDIHSPDGEKYFDALISLGESCASAGK